MLIDDYLPTYQVVEHHERAVAASPERAYAALWTADLATSPAVKALLALRTLPAVLFGRGPVAPPRLTLRDALRHGFQLVAEDAGREVLLAVSGRFWRPTGNVDASLDCRAALPDGMARAAWNFAVAARGAEASLVTTETRVQCAGVDALRRFRMYWWVVGPFSALIRRHMLDSIARTAEAPPR